MTALQMLPLLSIYSTAVSVGMLRWTSYDITTPYLATLLPLLCSPVLRVLAAFEHRGIFITIFSANILFEESENELPFESRAVSFPSDGAPYEPISSSAGSTLKSSVIHRCLWQLLVCLGFLYFL